MSNTTKQITEAIKGAQKSKTSAYDTQAEVRRVEGNTAWVHIPGGVDETPVKMTIAAKKGDTVQVRVSDGTAFLIGNASAPPTDDATANTAIYVATNAQTEADTAHKAAVDAVTSAEQAKASAESAASSALEALSSAQSAQQSADSALVSLSTVEDVVGVLNWITAHGTMTLTSDVAINPAHVYFVVDPTGDYVVGGTHYSIVAEPKVEDISTYYELSIDESVQNYVATHVVVDTEGLWLIPDSGGNKVLIATGAGSSYTTAGTYIIGKVSGVDTVFAKFTTDGVTMNATNSTQIAHLGYGTGTAESGTSTKPYYTFGVRSGTVGNYSVAEGNEVYIAGSGGTTKPLIASGYCSHAEGGGAQSSGAFSHAENCATEAKAHSSHAEGSFTIASGDFSHAQGNGTTAQRKSQTTLGEYNVLDTAGNTSTRGDYAVIIGNGTADNARSNALTVAWDGETEIKGLAKITKNGNTTTIGSQNGSWCHIYNSANVPFILNKTLATTEGDLGTSDYKWSKGYFKGQIFTSFKDSVAMGSYGSAQTTVGDFVNEVRMSSGCAGSVSIGTAYTKNGVTINTGWYNFMYMPHRSGGVNGSASGDNCNYGNLFLFGMNNTNGRFIVRISSGSIQEVAKIITSIEEKDYVKEQGTNSNGRYRKWNSGLIEAWGTYTASASTGYATCTLPVSFSDTNFAVTASIKYAGSTPSFGISTSNSAVNKTTVYVRTGANGIPSFATTIQLYAWGT